MHSLDDTIAAIATAPGGAARGIVRISGPDAPEIARRLITPVADAASVGSDKAARAIAGTVALALANRSDPQSLPCDLYLWPTALSYTRQPIAELHTIGSPPLLEALLRTVCAARARPAEPGEFTLRAFLAGRIDLVQAEAVLGVIDAADRSQLDVALAQLAGGLTRPLAALRNQLLDLLADLEAGLDFAEDDIHFIGREEMLHRLSSAADDIAQLVRQMQAREQTDVEPRVVLIGWPNVGKSSLFNALVRDQAAIVSPQPGTTRDYLSARLQLGEMSCRLIDTAGIETIIAAGTIADSAQQMTRDQHEQADLRILCLDATRTLNTWEESALAVSTPQIVALTKCDLYMSLPPGEHPSVLPLPPGEGPGEGNHQLTIPTSSLAGLGIDELKHAIQSVLASQPNESNTVAATATRCRDSLRLAGDSIARACDIVSSQAGDELIAAELRTALIELGKVVGAIYTDDVLDRIFSRFCIGK